jgi:glycosyltransferase involved in cell wall biosynthesis
MTYTDNMIQWYEKYNNFDKVKKVKTNLIYGNTDMKKTQYAIVIPAYKRPAYLDAALQSAINQEYNNQYKIIVLDDYADIDSSTDEIMKKYCTEYNNILYYRNAERLGTFSNFNRAFEVCDSDWICLLHDDDLMKPHHLSTCNSFHLDINKVGVLFNTHTILNEANLQRSGIKKIIEKINVAIESIKSHSHKLINVDYEINLFTPCCVLYNRQACLNVGGFDDTFYPGSDIAYWSKLIAHGYQCLKTKKSLSYYRLATNDTFNIDTQIKGFNFMQYFSKSYFYKKYPVSVAHKKYSKDITKTYYAWCMNYPNSKDVFDSLFKDLHLDSKYYTLREQKLLYSKMMILDALRKLF